MNREEIIQIARQEAQNMYKQMASADQFRFSPTNSHFHNGVDTSKVSQSNIVPNTRINGTITFATNTLYRLGLTARPTNIWFYGNAIQQNYIFTVTSANATAGVTYTNNSQSFVVLKTISGGTTLTTVGTGSPTSSGTLTKATNNYVFTITAGHAVAGATYTNNGQTFTVSASVASDTALYTTSTGAPTASGTLTLASGTGDATITFASASSVSGDATITFASFIHPVVVRSMVVGSAQLGPSLYFQPSTATSVTVIGSPTQNFTASSISYTIDSNNSDPVTGASVNVKSVSNSGALADVQFPGSGNVVARMTVVANSGNTTAVTAGDYLLLKVVLSQGWQFNGAIVVS